MSFTQPFNGLLVFFTDRAIEAAAAARVAEQTALGQTLAVRAAAQSITARLPSQTGRSITLELSPPTSGAAPISTLTFDVVLEASDGLMQRIEYRSRARQSIHQTFGGYYTDEFGLGPGVCDIDALVLFTGDPTSKIQAFETILQQAKALNPIQATGPQGQFAVLRLHDSYLSRSLILTQTELSISQSESELNRARIRIAADILFDYSSAANSAPAPSQPAVTSSNGLLTPFSSTAA